jgi:hypothetical protein
MNSFYYYPKRTEIEKGKKKKTVCNAISSGPIGWMPKEICACGPKVGQILGFDNTGRYLP